MVFDPEGPKQPIPPRVDLREPPGVRVPLVTPAEEPPPPLWMRFLSPAFWPVPALFACVIVLLKSDKVWVPVGPFHSRTAPSTSLFWMLGLGLIVYYIPWHRILGRYGDVMGQGGTFYSSYGPMRSNAVEGGCAGMLVRALGLFLFYALAYVYWKKFL